MTKAWLRDLEERVQETTARLRGLRSENEELKRRVGELEAEIAAAPGDEESAAWSEERGEIRQRVEKLVRHLDDLLRPGG